MRQFGSRDSKATMRSLESIRKALRPDRERIAFRHGEDQMVVVHRIRGRDRVQDVIEQRAVKAPLAWRRRQDSNL